MSSRFWLDRFLWRGAMGPSVFRGPQQQCGSCGGAVWTELQGSWREFRSCWKIECLLCSSYGSIKLENSLALFFFFFFYHRILTSPCVNVTNWRPQKDFHSSIYEWKTFHFNCFCRKMLKHFICIEQLFANVWVFFFVIVWLLSKTLLTSVLGF